MSRDFPTVVCLVSKTLLCCALLAFFVCLDSKMMVCCVMWCDYLPICYFILYTLLAIFPPFHWGKYLVIYYILYIWCEENSDLCLFLCHQSPLNPNPKTVCQTHAFASWTTCKPPYLFSTMSNQEETQLLQENGIRWYSRPTCTSANSLQWYHQAITIHPSQTFQFWEQSIIAFCNVKEEAIKQNSKVKCLLVWCYRPS